MNVQRDVNIDCFAYIQGKNACIALNDLYCKKQDCKFYKSHKQAKKDYFDHYNCMTSSMIGSHIHKHFEEL